MTVSLSLMMRIGRFESCITSQARGGPVGIPFINLRSNLFLKVSLGGKIALTMQGRCQLQRQLLVWLHVPSSTLH